uniref:WYL domain-containing protein n=2 Tax=Caenorhabditis tropicalis TaxID=1561998 RepID=A0A1I7UV40_9PELO
MNFMPAPFGCTIHLKEPFEMPQNIVLTGTMSRYNKTTVYYLIEKSDRRFFIHINYKDPKSVLIKIDRFELYSKMVQNPLVDMSNLYIVAKYEHFKRNTYDIAYKNMKKTTNLESICSKGFPEEPVVKRLMTRLLPAETIRWLEGRRRWKGGDVFEGLRLLMDDYFKTEKRPDLEKIKLPLRTLTIKTGYDRSHIEFRIRSGETRTIFYIDNEKGCLVWYDGFCRQMKQKYEELARIDFLNFVKYTENAFEELKVDCARLPPRFMKEPSIQIFLDIIRLAREKGLKVLDIRDEAIGKRWKRLEQIQNIYVVRMTLADFRDIVREKFSPRHGCTIEFMEPLVLGDEDFKAIGLRKRENETYAYESAIPTYNSRVKIVDPRKIVIDIPGLPK